MTRELFESQHEPSWRKLEALLDDLEAGRATPATSGFPALYRRVCSHLALARSRVYGADLEARLNRLALRGQQQLYRQGPLSWRGVVEFFAAGFPRAVRERLGLLWLCTALLYGPFLATFVAVRVQPDVVHAVLSPEEAASYEWMYRPEEGRNREASADVEMFGHYIQNNISIAFRVFAGGLLFGVGSIFVLVLNGVSFGAVAGHLVNEQLGGTFWSFVIGHGAFELTAIVLAGVTGLRLGLALVAPGARARSLALRQEALGSVPVVYGMTGMLTVAAALEAFWSSSTHIPGEVRLAVGAGLWLVVALYLGLGGRR
jgi:uncharacterized membrane protein SpoIIM required for sporulation